MKRTCLCLLLVLLLFCGAATFAVPQTTGFDLAGLTEDFVLLVNADAPTETVLGLEKCADDPCYPASTTKILTCILALERGDLDEWVKISANAVKLGKSSSKMGLAVDEQYRLRDLLYGLMLPSGNDAAIAIAEHLCGSVEAFADAMNEKAASLGMTNSHFVNPHGLHDEQHTTTARDMAILNAFALQNETFCEIVSTVQYKAVSKDGRTLKLKTSNRLLRDRTSQTFTPIPCLYAPCIGVKTGDTFWAGKCVVAAARKNNTTYIAVLFHGENVPPNATLKEQDAYNAQRYLDAIALFEYAFAHDMVTVTVDDLLDRALIDTYSVSLDPAKDGLLAAHYTIAWNPADSVTLPRYRADALLVDPFPSSMVGVTFRWYEKAYPAMGEAVITFEDEPLFSAKLQLAGVEFAVTPSPVPTATPSPTVTPPASAAPSPLPTDAPARSFWQTLLGWFRCAPYA